MIAAPTISAVIRDQSNARLRKLPLLLVLLALVCALNAPGMTVHLPGLDESAYLHRGALLIEQGALHPLADNPAPTLVNGAIYSLFHDERIQLEKVSTVRRWLTLFLLLAGVFYAAIRCGLAFRYAVIATLLTGTSPTLRFTINNSSDALYAVFLILSFGWAAGEIRNIQAQSPSRPIKYALFGWLLSALALSRSDGLIVGLFSLLLLGFVLKQNQMPLSAFGARLLSVIAAFCLPLLLWCLMAGLLTGDWSTHIPERSYVAFSQGQNILFVGQFIDLPNNPTAERLFGTANQNDNSVLRAVMHHPRAFAERAKRLPGNIKEAIVVAFGGKAECAITLLYLAVGITLLVIGRRAPFQQKVVLLGVVCLLPLAVYPLTFYRPGYFAMNFSVVTVLSMVGIAGWLSAKHSAIVERVATLILFSVVPLNCVQVWRGERQSPPQTAATSSERQWVRELRQTIPANTAVVAVDPSLLWYAHLEHSDDADIFLRSFTPPQLLAYMQLHHLQYVVLDQSMRQLYPRFANIVEKSRLQIRGKDSSYKAAIYYLPKL